ncbi:MAG: alanine racemase [Campylobacteraceae bacterium 4484_166]|nr:MAG: alanine racemase [Campylobacteraceae bacterium 4484_166]
MSRVVINKQNLYSNMDFFVQKLGSVDKLCVGLKDNAYGHGIEPIAKLCKSYGITNVFVKNLKEAKMIDRFDFDKVHILNYIPKIKTKYDITINYLEDIKKIPQNSNVQLKVDTGMHRNGIKPDEIKKAINQITKYKLNLSGIFSHYCCADEETIKTINQHKIFQKLLKKVEGKGNFEKHIANSSGVFRTDNELYDKARVGIGVYGYIDIPKYQKYLKPVMSLIANKSSTRIVRKGDRVGYGSDSYEVVKNTLAISNYDIGYGDGFFRIDENKSYFTPNNKEILGRVSMDSLSLNSIADEVVLFDDVRELAKLHNTITYEILTSINSELKRVVVY